MAKSPKDIHLMRPSSAPSQEVPTGAFTAPQSSTEFNGPHEELFDWQKVRHLGLFALNSIRRRLGLFLLIWLGLLSIAVAALKVMPKTYEVQSTILAQKSSILGSHLDTGREQPTRGAPDLITRTENLHALIDQTDLLKEWSKRRAPISRFKDLLMLKIQGPQTPTERLRSLTGLLQTNLVAWTTNDGTVHIKLTWPDAFMAYRLVDAVNQSFLEERHVREVSAIAEEISILEVHAAQLREEIDKHVAEVQQLRSSGQRERAAANSQRSNPLPVASASVNPELVDLRVKLEAKRRAIADIEEMRRRHLVELQTRLTEQRTVYSESHPILRDLEQNIESLKNESPQLVSLRQEEAELRQRLASIRGGASMGPTTSMPVIPPELFRVESSEDPLLEYARTQLRLSVLQYAGLRERINAARIDLDTTQAGFKYNYSVLQTPEVPRGPIKPKSQLVIAAAFIAGLVLAVFATSAADLRSGLMLETWQLENAIGPGHSIIEVRQL